MGRPALWRDIATHIEKDILDGVLKEGDQLPTESVLSDRFSVNRHTVRRALSYLTDEGLIYTKQGSGAFVSEDVMHYPIGSRVRFHKSVEAVGRHPSKRILHSERRKARRNEARALRLAEGSSVFHLESVGLINRVPISHAVTVFPADRLPNMLDELGKDPSISAALAAHGVGDFFRASTEVTAVLANATSASLLRTQPGAALIRTQSVSVDEKGLPVELGLTWFLGEKIILDIEGSGGVTEL
ncbi:MAG: phosphonate metabolism transcriptional regulator PhnF [Pseudomonadota bacterium]